MKAAFALAALALAAPLHAQAYQCRAPARLSAPPVAPDGPVRRMPIAGYTLAVSWSPEFCRGRNQATGNAVQCSGRNGRFGMVVHGLWPEGRQGWPQWCPTPRRPAPAELARNICMMPGAEMQAHEWAKHGSCMARQPEKYFAVTRVLWNGLRWPDFDRLSKDDPLTAGTIRQAIVAANPGWRGDAIGLVLSDSGWLRELRLCYDRRFRPARCAAARKGPSDNVPVKIWRGL